MSWDNSGKLWEIHHIKPISWFNFDNTEELKECWSLDNLTPLWKTTEIAKQMGDDSIGNRNIKNTTIYNPNKKD